MKRIDWDRLEASRQRADEALFEAGEQPVIPCAGCRCDGVDLHECESCSDMVCDDCCRTTTIGDDEYSLCNKCMGREHLSGGVR